MDKLRKGLERNLNLSHLSIEQAPDAILWIDSSGRIHRANRAACQLLGYSQDEFLSIDISKLHRESEKLWSERWSDLREKGGFLYEDRLFVKGGQSIIAEVSGSFIEFEGEEYLCCLVRDIAGSRRKDEDYRNALAELEQLRERLQREVSYLRQEIRLTHNFGEIISDNDKFKQILAEVEQVASTEATVLILGETGTGKELVARAIHNISPRRHRPMIKVSCVAFPDSLIESELFGYEKGAFTGAVARKIGRFELAHGTTIFLDEIGDLPLGLQVKLLRVLQEGEFERLGSSHTIKIDTRIIAATNRDLERAVAEGRFREDLYYRLNVFPIYMMPLRERKDDIPILVQYFVEKYSAKVGKKIDRISQKVMEQLQAYYWPGNVRELENVIERAVIISRGGQLEPGKWLIREGSAPEAQNMVTLEEVEREYITRVLKQTKWQVSGDKGAAKILGMNPHTLFSRMKKLGITRPT
jgi:formate hydrogenlyase transcriptional activator